MSDDTETTEGAVDDDAIERAKENKRKKEEQLKKLFSDNKTGRYGKAVDA